MLSRRSMMKSTLALGSAALLPGRASAAGLGSVLRRHAAARGSMRGIHSMTAALEITEQGATVTGHYAARRTPARMRIDIFYRDKRVWSEGLDGQGAWKQEGKDDAPGASDKGASALMHGILFNLYGLEDLPSAGARLSYAGTEDVDGVGYHRVQATLPDGFQTTFYIDPGTWLLSRRRDVRPIHPDIDDTFKPMENAYGDYRRVGGVMTAFRSWQTDLTLGKTLQTTLTTALAYNVAATDEMLARTAKPL
jgi:hypothetical protein